MITGVIKNQVDHIDLKVNVELNQLFTGSMGTRGTIGI